MPPRVVATCLAALAGAAAAIPASADDEVLTETRYFGDLPQVLTATRLAQPALEAPSSITVIRREQIRAAGARDVAELMRLVPGFQVAYFAAHRPVVTYHGLSDDFARRLQVLVDGRSVYTPLFGGVLWSSLSLSVEDIERIEVIRAPNAASYGPNSFSAIINIVTTHAASDSGAEISATAGERDQADGFARGHGSVGAGHYRVSLEHEQDDGFEGRHDGRDLERLEARIDYPLAAGDELTAKLGATVADLDVGRFDADPAAGRVNVPRTLAFDAGFAQLAWRRRLGADASVSLQYYANHDRWTDDRTFDSSDGLVVPGTTDPSVRVDQNAEATRHDLELVYTGRLSERTRVVAGSGARHESVESRWLFGTREAQTNTVLRAFGHLEHRLRPRTVLHAGALVEDNDITGTSVSPRVALVQRTAPHQRLRLSVSHATRTPALFEQRQERFFIVRSDNNDPFRFYTGLTEADLDPERVRAVELGYRVQPPGQRWAMDVKLFREHVRDLLVEVPTSPPDGAQSDENMTGFVNGFSARLEGIEGSLSLQPTRALELRLWGSGTSIDRARAISDAIRDELTASVPDVTAGLQGIYRLSATRMLSVDYYYHERMNWIDKTGATDADRLDVQYREELGGAAPSGFFALRLDNVLGPYAEYDDDNVFDTRLSLQAGLRF